MVGVSNSAKHDKSTHLGHPLQARKQPRTKVTQPANGLSGWLGVGREWRGVCREDNERQEGHQVTRSVQPPPFIIPPHPPSHLSILAWEGVI